MRREYIIALDQGTTSSKVVIFDSDTNTRYAKSKPLKQIYPQPGWVEHDPEEIWLDQLELLRGALNDSGIQPGDIKGIGITNQRETAVVWNRNTGKPVYNAIVWQCRRTADICESLIGKGLDIPIREKTGLPVDAYFSGTKIKWILENVEGVRKLAEAGDVLAGTIDSWLIWNLTGGKHHITDYSNASRTMLFNINKLEWDVDLLKILDIPSLMLPRVVASSGICGETSEELLGARIPVSGIAGDQQASLFGQACFDEGSVKNTYGTGCFILMNTGKNPVVSRNHLITTIAWSIGDEIEYALEGSVFNAGSAIQWLRDGLHMIESAQQSDILARQVPDTAGVYIVPAFTGLGAPYWDMYARGTIVGITRGTEREHIVRAVLESVAYQSRDVLEAMKEDYSGCVSELKVDGGASANTFLMQYQADMLGIKVKRPMITETTALGAAYLAGLGTGLWKSRQDIRDRWKLDKIFTPEMDISDREYRYKQWKRAVERSLKWVE